MAMHRATGENIYLQKAKAMAMKIASMGPVAVKLAKHVVNRGSEIDLDTALNYEIESVSSRSRRKSTFMACFLMLSSMCSSRYLVPMR